MDGFEVPSELSDAVPYFVAYAAKRQIDATSYDANFVLLAKLMLSAYGANEAWLQ